MQADEVTQDPTQLLAVVGMAGRFASAREVDSFWQLLLDGRDAIRPVPARRWDASAQLDPEKAIQSVGGFLDDVEQFDATFFGISPREAEVLDPQQRLLLEASWQALEDAGIPAESVAGSRTGVYVGTVWHDYELLRKNQGAGTTQHSAVGNAADVLSARVSYFLRLTGPSMAVETGCSSSLVALHLAAQALRSGEIEGAIVGGVNLILAPDVSIGLTHFGGLSPDGRCKSFGAGADGFVRGEGIAAAYVKRLDHALRDGDRIHGVIAATAVNNDGGGKSLVTPNPASQEALLRGVYDNSGLSIDDIAYIEAHGTGTKRGDPIEAGVIGRVLGQARDRARGPLPIGAVKSNIGHLEAASGLAGLFKAVLALKHRIVPASLNAEQLNPEIPFDDLNLCVAREALPLSETDRLIGVNSFGWGGTNAHVTVLGPEEITGERTAPAEPARSIEQDGPVLLPLSAHSEQALRQRARQLRETLATGAVAVPAVAGTLAWQRDHFPVRAAITVTDPEQAQDRLERIAADPGDEIPDVVSGRAGTVGRTAFVFPGQGSQWADMGRELLAADDTFAAVIHRCARALEPHIDWDLVKTVSGAAGDEWLSRVDMLQPTLWAVSAGLAEVWREAGVEPDVVIGHSQGEVTAATVAGALSYEDAALAVAKRSALARRTSGKGRMLAVDLSVAGAKAAIEGFEHGVALAVNNGPNSCVLSGDADLIDVLKELLEADGTFCRLVNVDYASHSPQMDELEADLLDALEPVRPRDGDIPVMSTVQVASLRGPELDTRYWVDNLRRPVMFADAMDALFDDGVTHVVEISPHPILTPAIEQLAAQRDEPPAVLSTLRRDSGSPRAFGDALARAYAAGLRPFGGLPRKSWAPVPGYPWQRDEYWVEPGRRRGPGNTGLDVVLTPAVTEQDSWTGTLELALDDVPWLRDHRVHDAVVLPGVGMMTLALRAALARTGAVPRTIAGLRFLSDLTLTDEPATLNVQWRDDVTEGGSVGLFSLPDGARTWTQHASARVLLAQREPVTEPFPEHLRNAESVAPEEFYADRARLGLNYGPAFQTVTSLRQGDGEALAEVRLGEQCLVGARAGDIHPALCDGALQACLPLYAGEEALVPTEVRRVHLCQDLAEPVTALWSHAVRREHTLFDVYLFDVDGHPLVTFEGLRMAPLATVSGAADTDAERSHRLVFTEQPRTAAGIADGPWLVCADPAGAREAEDLAAALGALGVTAGTALVTGDAAADTATWDERLRGAGDVAGVAFLAPRATDGEAAQRAGLLTLTALVRSCVSRPVPPRMVVLTTDAQGVTVDDRCDPGSALYWGFGRVLRREHAELRPSLVDIGPDGGAWASGAAAELLDTRGADQVVLRGERRFVGRLVRGEADFGESTGKPDWRTPEQPFRVVSERPGSRDGLTFRPLTRRMPGPGEIEIAVTSSALSFADVRTATGGGPERLGLGGAGVVTRVGCGVTGFAEGDRVATCAPGSLASHQIVPAGHAHRAPEWLSDADAAALPAVLTMAWYGLGELARLRAGETVLIHSAAGGLGLAAVQVATVLGAEVIATAGCEDKRRYLRALGVQHVFDSRDLAWSDDVRAATGGRGVDVVLNSLTGAAISHGLEVLAEDGRFIEVGAKDVTGGRSIDLAAFRKGISFAAIDLAGLAERRPEHVARLFAEVWQRVTTGELTPLPLLRYPFAAAAEALREMSEARHIGRFVVSDPSTVTAIAPEPMPGGHFRPDGTYLITGGLGALGLSLAEFLADRGARALALAGRSAPGADAVRRIEGLRVRGIRVETVQTDVADPQSLEGALTRLRAELPPLRGVVHAAGLLDDATIQNLTPDQLHRVLAPKVDGARNLDAATAGDPLDFFVLFSSAAALLGNAGQAAYAAGNAYLDTLAVARRQRGLPGLSVQWGVFTEIGLAAREDNRGARLEDRGMTGFTAEQAWQALVRYLGQDEQVVGYVPLNLRQWFEAYPDTAALESWSELRQAAQDGDAGSGNGSAFLTELQSAPEASRHELLEDKVRELAGRALRLEPKAIDRDTPFKSLGLDSLIGLELRNRLESAFSMKLSPTLLWTYGSTRALSGVLAEQLFSEPALVDSKD